MSEDKGTTARARRGDLLVVHRHHRDFPVRGEPREYDTFTVGMVTSITRDGKVMMFKEAGHADEPDWRGRPDRGQALPTVGFVQALVRGAADIDVPGALATASCRTWELTGSTRPYDALDEVRAALSPHFKTRPTWEPLHHAARTHAAARRAAWEAYRRDRQTAGWDNARYDAYTAQVAAADQEYLRAYAQITAPQPQPVPGTPSPERTVRHAAADAPRAAEREQAPEPGM
jgi:hypothetical protein